MIFDEDDLGLEAVEAEIYEQTQAEEGWRKSELAAPSFTVLMLLSNRL